MESNFFLSGMGILFLVALMLSVLFAIKVFLNWYKAINNTAMKTQITVYELQKIMASRSHINRK